MTLTQRPLSKDFVDLSMTSTKVLVKHLLNTTGGETQSSLLRYFVLPQAFNL